MSFFRSVSRRLRQGPFFIPVFFVFVGLAIVASFAAWADYYSSVQGYAMLPTRKPRGELMPWIIGALPQLGQIGFMYAFAETLEKRNGKWVGNNLYTFMTVFLFLFDITTDVWYKASGGDFFTYIIALIESLVVFTIGSEVLTVLSYGMVINMLPDFIKAIGNLLGSLFADDEEEGGSAHAPGGYGKR